MLKQYKNNAIIDIPEAIVSQTESKIIKPTFWGHPYFKPLLSSHPE